MKQALLRLTLLLPLAMASACAEPAPPPPPAAPPDTRAQDEAAIRAASKDWAAAIQKKDAAAFTSFYGSDAAVLLAGMPTTKGKAAIETMIGDMVKDPNFALSFTTDDVEVARSGDLAYETGTWQMTSTDPATKKPATAKGDFVTVWKKQADGTWKCVVDAPVPGPAAAAPKS